MALWPLDDGTLSWVWDGVAGEPFDAIGEMRDKTPCVFASADGGHVAYMATRGDRHFVGRDALHKMIKAAQLHGLKVRGNDTPINFFNSCGVSA